MTILELTLAIIKPHIVKNPVFLDAVRNVILNSDFKIVKSKRKRISLDEATHFYEEHKHKFFYNRLVTFMTSGPSDLYVLAKENAIRDWRSLMGPTKSFKAQYEAPNTLRGRFGLSDTRNATHGSDSPESARREIQIFFPDFNVDEWYRTAEQKFRSNLIIFSKEEFIHKIVDT
ncbi:nucleoside diphosphate kinase 6 [Cylas formicarius]|uniref:nucleoside diphosphate kinase 6 n=1 Tax=Cylas formicarius TaxID=197179 RepID=UPI0029584B3E|nr:nucleoside diphosphate kinase 6 [Cylas formicarius]